MSAAENLRLRVLLTWAVEFVERENGVMEYSFTDGEGNVDAGDEDVAAAMADARRWLKEAREALS